MRLTALRLFRKVFICHPKPYALNPEPFFVNPFFLKKRTLNPSENRKPSLSGSSWSLADRGRRIGAEGFLLQRRSIGSLRFPAPMAKVANRSQRRAKDRRSI